MRYLAYTRLACDSSPNSSPDEERHNKRELGAGEHELLREHHLPRERRRNARVPEILTFP
jgi:hypothetical protein